MCETTASDVICGPQGPGRGRARGAASFVTLLETFLPRSTSDGITSRYPRSSRFYLRWRRCRREQESPRSVAVSLSAWVCFSGADHQSHVATSLRQAPPPCLPLCSPTFLLDTLKAARRRKPRAPANGDGVLVGQWPGGGASLTSELHFYTWFSRSSAWSRCQRALQLRQLCTS